MVTKETKTRLMKKGWTEEQIKKAEESIESRRFHDKSRSIVTSNRILFWSMLFVIIIGNALIALILIPFLLVFDKFAVNIFIVVIGFAVGLLFNFLVWDIEHLTIKHHLLAAIIIPVLAIVDLYAIVKISNAINEVFEITVIRGDPILISAVYVIAFLVPYLWTIFVKKKIKRY